jgi:SAM-dependent methyltransferase
MSIATRLYAYVLQQTRSRRGYWGEWYYLERYSKALAAITKLGVPFSSVLEIGCGRGLYALVLQKLKSDCTYIGCDLDRATLDQAFRNGNSSYVLCDVRMLPIKNKCVDLVLCSEVLEHLSSPYEILSSVVDVSRKGVLITFPVESLGNLINVMHPEHILNIELGKIVSSLTFKKLKMLSVSEIARFFLPCGVLEFLGVPKNRFTMLLVESVNMVFKKLIPLTLVPNRVISVIAVREDQ